MIARCIFNSGSDLSNPARDSFYTEHTVFHLVVGKEYVVVGLGIFETVLVALVCDETGKPGWLPVGLFEFDVSSMPSDWEFALYDGVAASGGDSLNRWVARWGYHELVADKTHSDGLVERNPHDLEVFYRELGRWSSGAGL